MSLQSLSYPILDAQFKSITCTGPITGTISTDTVTGDPDATITGAVGGNGNVNITATGTGTVNVTGALDCTGVISSDASVDSGVINMRDPSGGGNKNYQWIAASGVLSFTAQSSAGDVADLLTTLVSTADPNAAYMVLGFANTNQANKNTIAQNASSFTVNNPYIKAGSIIMATVNGIVGTGGADTTCTSVAGITITPNTNFVVHCNDNVAAAAGVSVSWFIVRY